MRIDDLPSGSRHPGPLAASGIVGRQLPSGTFNSRRRWAECSVRLRDETRTRKQRPAEPVLGKEVNLRAACHHKWHDVAGPGGRDHGSPGIRQARPGFLGAGAHVIRVGV